MTLDKLYSLAHEISEDMQYLNKYTWLGYNKLLPVKYFDINDTMELDMPINSYIVEHETILLFPNMVNGAIIDLNLKPLDNKVIKTFKKTSLPYNIGKLQDDFKYGQPLFLVEGIADLAGLRLVDKKINICAIRTNSVPKDMYETYAAITNKIVLVLDDDTAGKSQLNTIKRRFKELNVSVYTINQFGNLKDTGEIVELVMKYQQTKDKTHLELLNLINIYYKSQISLIKNS